MIQFDFSERRDSGKSKLICVTRRRFSEEPKYKAINRPPSLPYPSPMNFGGIRLDDWREFLRSVGSRSKSRFHLQQSGSGATRRRDEKINRSTDQPIVPPFKAPPIGLSPRTTLDLSDRNAQKSPIGRDSWRKSQSPRNATSY